MLSYEIGEAAYVTHTSGDAATLVYGVFYADPTNPDTCENGGEEPCLYEFDGAVKRVGTTDARAIPQAEPPSLVVASAGRVAIVPADTTPRFSRESRPTPHVYVRDATTGDQICSGTAAGTIKALAFSGTGVALLVRDPAGNKSIERRDASTCALLGSTPVARGVADELDKASNTIVYRQGRFIGAVDATTGAKRPLWRAAVEPIGLSIEGRRVAWVANVNGDGYVRSLLAE